MLRIIDDRARMRKRGVAAGITVVTGVGGQRHRVPTGSGRDGLGVQ
jgi:hypothetical protein